MTLFGVEARDGRYAIEARRLREEHWLEHMSEKEWVDADDFATAWLVALTLHGNGMGRYSSVRKAIGRFPPVKSRE